MATPFAENASLERHCLVTIGATAAFTALLDAATKLTFLELLVERGYTHLHLQCGTEADRYHTAMRGLNFGKMTVEVFEFVDDLRSEKMILCRGEVGKRMAGVIVSHAGTGTVLDAMRAGAPFILVPNPTLKDNHQEELAEEMQRQGYAIWGKLHNLEYAIEQTEVLRSENAVRWTANPVSHPATPAVDLWDIAGAAATRYVATNTTAASGPAAPSQLESVPVEDSGPKGIKSGSKKRKTAKPESEREDAVRMALD